MSPPLSWRLAPKSTKSFAITMADAEAKPGDRKWLWIMYDIPASVRAVPSDAGNPKAERTSPVGLHALNDYGTAGYHGPCRLRMGNSRKYVLSLHALDVPSLQASAQNPREILKLLATHDIARRSLTVSVRAGR